MNGNRPDDGSIDDQVSQARLDSLAPMLRDPAVWSEPPSGAADSLVAAIAADRRQHSSSSVTREPATLSDLASRRRRRRAAAWLGVAAAAVILAVGVGLVLSRDDDATKGEQIAIAGTELAPRSSATAIVSNLGAGVAIRLDVQGLDPAPEGSYYHGWLQDTDGDLVSIGTFHMRSGDSTVTLWSGVDVAEYPTLTVTLQSEDDAVGSSGDVVLRGTLAG